MSEYTITVENHDGIDIVTTSNPVYAVELIQELRWRDGHEVTYTGDPFADAAALAEMED